MMKEGRREEGRKRREVTREGRRKEKQEENVRINEDGFCLILFQYTNFILFLLEGKTKES